MSGATPDLIAGYLAELCAGLRLPAAEAELIVAEAEDHLRETAAVGLAIGMTEREAQEAAISSFGPVRTVVRAHRRRRVTAGAVAMAAWKLTALLTATVGAGGLAGMGIVAFLLRSVPGGPPPIPPVEIVYAALAAGGLVLLATRRLARRGAPARDLLPPGVTAGCFLLASALLWIFGFVLRSVPAAPPAPAGPPSGAAPFSPFSDTGGPAVTVLIAYAVMAAGVLALLAARRLAGRGFPGRDPLSPEVAATCFLLASAPLVALIVSIASGVTMIIAPMFTVSWMTPYSVGTVSSIPLVPGAVVAGCLAVALGYGVKAALRRARRVRRRPGSDAYALPSPASG